MNSKLFVFVILGFSICFFSSCTQKASKPLLKADDILLQHREQYKQGFLKDQRSPLKTESEVALLDFFNYDASFDIQCKVVKAENPQPFDMPTYSGTSKVYIKYGNAQCPLNEKIVSITLYKSAMAFQNPIYQDHLFLPFKDETNGELTYGGGRYIDLNIHDINNDSIRIDFNKCYNPWCAYSEGYSCPIPPKENNFNFSINAGEKSFKGSIKKKK